MPTKEEQAQSVTDHNDEWRSADDDLVSGYGEADELPAVAAQPDPSPVDDEGPSRESARDAYVSAWQEKDTPKPVEEMSFKDAFAKHRSAGDKVFEWKGKSYTTELAKSTTKPASAAPKVSAVQAQVRASEPKAPAAQPAEVANNGKPVGFAPVKAVTKTEAMRLGYTRS